MAASLVACGGKSKDTKPSDVFAEDQEEIVNTVVVAMGGGFTTMDPGHIYEKYPLVAINACYETLFKFYGDSEPMPCLADTYEFSNGGLTLTVKLKDAKFASGNPVTSEDVAFSINRTKNLQGNPSFIADTLESIETPDEKTVVFHLTQPDSAILSKLTWKSRRSKSSFVGKASYCFTNCSKAEEIWGEGISSLVLRANDAGRNSPGVTRLNRSSTVPAISRWCSFLTKLNDRGLSM